MFGTTDIASRLEKLQPITFRSTHGDIDNDGENEDVVHANNNDEGSRRSNSDSEGTQRETTV